MCQRSAPPPRLSLRWWLFLAADDGLLDTLLKTLHCPPVVQQLLLFCCDSSSLAPVTSMWFDQREREMKKIMSASHKFVKIYSFNTTWMRKKAKWLLVYIRCWRKCPNFIQWSNYIILFIKYILQHWHLIKYKCIVYHENIFLGFPQSHCKSLHQSGTSWWLKQNRIKIHETQNVQQQSQYWNKYRYESQWHFSSSLLCYISTNS